MHETRAYLQRLRRLGGDLLGQRFGLLGDTLLVRCNAAAPPVGSGIFEHQVDGLPRNLREDFILGATTGKRVLHVGFLDAPFTEERLRDGTLLHRRIAEVAKQLYGVDVAAESLDRYRAMTGDLNNALLDVQTMPVALGQPFDVVVLSEVLEHLPNPMAALGHLRTLCASPPGCDLLVTVPNAYSLEHFAAAANNLERVHQDHYYYFSPTTLRRLLTDAGFRDVTVSLYAHRPERLGNPGATLEGVAAIARVGRD
jgi:hypothetical protein